MQKTCTNPWCNTSFEVTDQDIKFYDKISPVFAGKKYQIPSPTMCPSCRLQRRFAFRNARQFYNRKCDLTGKDIISIYAPGTPYKVYDSDEWWSDRWDPKEYGREFDFSLPFFEQFDELIRGVPRPNLMREQCENCKYAHNTTRSRNCYLCPMLFYGEDCYYVSMSSNCKSVVDSQSLLNCELCYDTLHTQDSYGCIACQDCMSCTDCSFCFDCTGCEKCIGCIGLNRKKLHVFNAPVTEEKYKEYRDRFRSFSIYRKMWQHTRETWKDAPRRSSLQISSENCTGNHIYNSRNAHHCFQVNDCEDSKYCHNAKQFKDSMDVFGALMGGELQYECSAAGGGVHTLFAYLSWHNSDCYYLNYCHNSHDLFGCIGLRHAEYCILNKQYTKEEYEALVPQIIDHMSKTGEWGYFFPPSISPYYYNETYATDYFSLSKEEVQSKGWKWKDEAIEIPKVEKVIPAERLPDSTDDIPDDVLNWAIKCEKTGRPFIITKQELEFYRKMGLPVPRLSPGERFRARLARCNPRRLWKRQCEKCEKEIQTTYSPDRKETVYCEDCYLKEVY